MPPRPRWLVVLTVGTLLFAIGVWLLLASRDTPGGDALLLATSLAGIGLLLDTVGAVGLVASALRDPQARDS